MLRRETIQQPTCELRRRSSSAAATTASSTPPTSRAPAARCSCSSGATCSAAPRSPKRSSPASSSRSARTSSRCCGRRSSASSTCRATASRSCRSTARSRRCRTATTSGASTITRRRAARSRGTRKLDAEAYDEYGKAMVEMGRFVKPILDMTPPDPTSLDPRGLLDLLVARPALPRHALRRRQVQPGPAA